jgi:hypothetical protein
MLGQVKLFSKASALNLEVLPIEFSYDNFSRDKKIICAEDEQPLVQEVEEETLEIIA